MKHEPDSYVYINWAAVLVLITAAFMWGVILWRLTQWFPSLFR